MKEFIARILSSKIFLIFTLFLYRVLIDFSYIYIISPNYKYAGLYLELNTFKLIESYILLFVFSLLLKHRVNKPSEFFILFFFSIIAVPLLSIYSLQDKSREFMYMVLLSFLIIISASKITQVRIPIIPNGSIIAIAINILTGILLFTWIIIRGGFLYLNFDLLKVYDFRETVAELLFPGKLAYIMSWFGNVMNPSLIAFSLLKKNKALFIVAISAQVIFFAVTTHKAMLFYPALIAFAFLFGRKKYLGQMIPLGLAGVTLVSSALYYITNNILPLSLYVRRVLFVTADNHYRYFDTFHELGFLYYSDRAWFPKFIEYPFDLPVPQVISMIYYGNIGTWVNTGFLATGYMNFGFLGMVLYSVIIGVIFRFIDYISNRYSPVWFCIAMMIAPIFSLVSADLPTALISHGILLALIMLWMMSSDSQGAEQLRKDMH